MTKYKPMLLDSGSTSTVNKIMTRSMKKLFIKRALDNGSLFYNENRKATVRLTIHDIKNISISDRLCFLNIYYCYGTISNYAIEEWIEDLRNHKIEVTLFPKSLLQMALFPLALDDEQYDNVGNFFKKYDRIVKDILELKRLYRIESAKLSLKRDHIDNILNTAGIIV